MSLVQEICAVSGVWLLNEKGALARAAAQSAAPANLEDRVRAALLVGDIPALRMLNAEICPPATFRKPS